MKNSLNVNVTVWTPEGDFYDYAVRVVLSDDGRIHLRDLENKMNDCWVDRAPYCGWAIAKVVANAQDGGAKLASFSMSKNEALCTRFAPTGKAILQVWEVPTKEGVSA